MLNSTMQKLSPKFNLEQNNKWDSENSGYY